MLNVNKFLEISPRNYPLSISKAKILLAMKKYFESEEIIRDQLLTKNNNPELWLLLSEIQRSSKNIVGKDIKPSFPKNPHITINNDFKKSINKLSIEVMEKFKDKIVK